MTKKTYVAVALILKAELISSTKGDEIDKVVSIAYSLADMFAEDNERFDRERFLVAAGVKKVIERTAEI